jgi:hypothetical protein
MLGIFGNSKVYTCSKHNYSGVNEPCPDCAIELLNQTGEKMKKNEPQSLHWQQEKPTKDCILATREKFGDKWVYKVWTINDAFGRSWLQSLKDREYLILEEL